ncbi:uncharacterized protein SCHCODRAFT_02494096 [Schizophyllum commune H4-8]|nr:uncharacterized protein SCHCODRAFT_02494096 [Schizophyllum commune H4-8]KAI5896188.1 hypothetical protein SCHCODRAFT_02494096 [Schizophyllum commune H4-8]
MTPRYRTYFHTEIRGLSQARHFELIPLILRPIPAPPGPTRSARACWRAHPYSNRPIPTTESSATDTEPEDDASSGRTFAVNVNNPTSSGTTSNDADAQQPGGVVHVSDHREADHPLPGRHRRGQGQSPTTALEPLVPRREGENARSELGKLDWDEARYSAVKDWVKHNVERVLDVKRPYDKQNSQQVEDICARVSLSSVPISGFLSRFPARHYPNKERSCTTLSVVTARTRRHELYVPTVFVGTYSIRRRWSHTRFVDDDPVRIAHTDFVYTGAL